MRCIALSRQVGVPQRNLMELKEYQVSTLDAFTRWLDELALAKKESAKAAEALRAVGVDISDDVLNYPKTAWQDLAASGGVAETAGKEYVSRTDDAGRPIPHICFKIPTGGGKTLLATAALERLNRQTGLTLWITPTKAIYQQTKAALKNREHPYRQMLERASGGKFKLLEKDDAFTRADVEHYMCVMLLMLPAANRRKGRDFLRMFRDSGRYPTLFPDTDDAFGDARLLNDHPDLEKSPGDLVKHSLFNVFKILRPVVILDEAHKAYGAKSRESNEEFVRSVNRLDPSLVIELSATPNRGISNLLVDVTGVELKQEEMIKLPVQVTSYREADWQHTLAGAHEELAKLEAEARSLYLSEGHYIRPIAVVRVERTGREQRDGEKVHAEDVREYLSQNLGVPSEQIVVKSAELDELGKEDLLSEFSPVRWIITKAALMEGWDCSFAYLLVMLDNTQAQKAITQLVGRVMRQPYARRTDREILDQCYVHCWNTEVGNAVQFVKNGLEAEGLTGLGDEVVSASDEIQSLEIVRRKQFRNSTIFLPQVLHQQNGKWEELDYQRHILPSVNWDLLDAHDPQSSALDRASIQQATVDVGDVPTVWHKDRDLFVDKTVKISWYARRLSDIVPNPWQASRIAQDLVDKFKQGEQTGEEAYDRRSQLAYELRAHVARSIEFRTQQVFQRKVGEGTIRFDLEAGLPSYQMIEKYEIPASIDEHALMSYGKPLQLSLFEPVFERQFDNDLERSFARYMDEHRAIRWWHRVAVRQRGEYFLKGWKQDRIWPDFIAMADDSSGKSQLLIFETKGEHLRGNPDTEYKEHVFETLQQAFNCGTMTINDGPAKGVFRLVFKDDFASALASLDEVV